IGTLLGRQIEALALRQRRRADRYARLAACAAGLGGRAGLGGALERSEIETRAALRWGGAAFRTELIWLRTRLSGSACLGGALHRGRAEAAAGDVALTVAQAALQRRAAGRPAAPDRRGALLQATRDPRVAGALAVLNAGRTGRKRVRKARLARCATT